MNLQRWRVHRGRMSFFQHLPRIELGKIPFGVYTYAYFPKCVSRRMGTPGAGGKVVSEVRT